MKLQQEELSKLREVIVQEYYKPEIMRKVDAVLDKAGISVFAAMNKDNWGFDEDDLDWTMGARSWLFRFKPFMEIVAHIETDMDTLRIQNVHISVSDHDYPPE